MDKTLPPATSSDKSSSTTTTTVDATIRKDGGIRGTTRMHRTWCRLRCCTVETFFFFGSVGLHHFYPSPVHTRESRKRRNRVTASFLERHRKLGHVYLKTWRGCARGAYLRTHTKTLASRRNQKKNEYHPAPPPPPPNVPRPPFYVGRPHRFSSYA